MKTKKEDVEKFAEILSATENFSNSCKQLWFRSSKGVFKEIFCYNQLNDNFDERLQNTPINPKVDYYITKNSFYADKRTLKSLFSCDLVVIDIDNHIPTTSFIIKAEIIRLLFFMGADYSSRIPAPNMFVPTGRGVQLWYKIESISSKLLFLYEAVTKHFCDVLSEIIEENNIDLKVDYNASCNPVGLVRLPFTYNTISQTFVEVEFYEDCIYNINDLIEEYEIEIPTKTVHQNEQSQTNIEKDVEYIRLHMKRSRFIADLEKCNAIYEGRRNNMLFAYYNALVQVYDRQKAVAMTETLNNQLEKPLKDLRYIYHYIDKVGFLKFGEDKFINFLGLSNDEEGQYRAMSTYKPKINKEERNKKIFQLAVQRKTCQQIADEVGCSERTVRTVLKKFDKKEFLALQVKELRKNMTIKQVAETLNVCPDTVKRLQKGG